MAAPPYSPISVTTVSQNYSFTDSNAEELLVESETELGMEHEEQQLLVLSTVYMIVQCSHLAWLP